MASQVFPVAFVRGGTMYGSRVAQGAVGASASGTEQGGRRTSDYLLF